MNVADITTDLDSLTKNFIRTETTYDANKNYVVATKDARGNTVAKDVDSNTGLVKSVTDPEQQKVNYEYDNAKRVIKVSTDVDSNSYVNTYTYDHDRIKTVSHNTTTATPDVTYTFNYDSLGRKTSVEVGDPALETKQVLSTNHYKEDSRSSLIERVCYGTYDEEQGKYKCGEVAYTYDEFDRMTGVMYDGATTPRYSYDYGNNGQVGEVRDNNLGRITRTEYDLIDRPCKVEITDNTAQENLLYRTQLKYDKRSNLKTFFEKLPDQEYATDYTYDNDNRITNLTYHYSDDAEAPAASVEYEFNPLGRVALRTAKVGDSSYVTDYDYLTGGYPTPSGSTAKSHTMLVAKITQGSGANAMNFIYEYDSRGNITSETRNGVVTTYKYDALGQLIRVNDPNDTTAGADGTTWAYEYDFGGNILKKTYYAYTTADTLSGGTAINYGYDNDWKDKLVSYDGKSMVYDEIGNLKQFDGWEYTWEGGRQLKKMVKGTTTIEFKYNHNGLRTHKIVTENGVTTTTEYTLHGKLITHLTKRVVNGQNVETDREELHFFYDSQSRPAFVEYDGAMYRYVHNLQGDIVAIVDAAGNIVVEYKYDAWGKPIGDLSESGIGEINPFRCRGYVWDEGSGLYYLRSRYYCINIMRYISADSIIVQGIIQANLFCYCVNKPVILCDENGKLPAFALLYCNAFITEEGEKYDFSKSEPFRNAFTEAVSKSSIVRKRVAEYIDQLPTGAKTYTKTDSIHWPLKKSLMHVQMADVDLALAVGTISFFTLTVEKQEKNWLEKMIYMGDKYKVTYTIPDKYDFDKWEGTERDAISIFINDTFGYNPQEKGILNEYYYQVSGEFFIYHF